DWRLGVTEAHVQPHLAIGDVAAGQGQFLIGVKNRFLSGRPRSPTNAPPPGARRSPDSQRQSGYALLSSRTRRHFLIQIDARLSPCLPRRTVARKPFSRRAPRRLRPAVG